jgi:hypothetical protein
MSQVKWSTPVKLYKIDRGRLKGIYEDLRVEMPFPPQYNCYFHPDLDGWTKIIPHLLIKSALYKPDVRTCSWYSFKAYTLCNELFEANTLLPTQGDHPLGRHAFNSFYDGERLWLFEPNDGFKDERGTWQDLWGYLDGDIVFPWGANGYSSTHVLL